MGSVVPRKAAIAIAGLAALFVGGDRAQAVPACTDYPQARQFVDAQAWWTRTPGASGTDYGHAHLGACIPERENISVPQTLDVRVILHNNPGKLQYVSLVSKTKRQEITQAKDYSLAGLTCPVGTCEGWMRFPLDPGWFDRSGLQEVRLRAFVKEPDGNQMVVSINWQAYFWNNRPRDDVTRQPYLRGKGWYTGAGYCDADLVSVPLPDDPLSGLWSPYLRLVWHAELGDLQVTHHTVRLDPDFHNGIPGTILNDGPGPWEGSQPVPAAAGTHTLFERSDCDDPRGSTNSGVLVVPFAQL